MSPFRPVPGPGHIIANQIVEKCAETYFRISDVFANDLDNRKYFDLRQYLHLPHEVVSIYLIRAESTTVKIIFGETTTEKKKKENSKINLNSKSFAQRLHTQHSTEHSNIERTQSRANRVHSTSYRAANAIRPIHFGRSEYTSQTQFRRNTVLSMANSSRVNNVYGGRGHYNRCFTLSAAVLTNSNEIGFLRCSEYILSEFRISQFRTIVDRYYLRHGRRSSFKESHKIKFE